jgi:hypothetical protein
VASSVSITSKWLVLDDGDRTWRFERAWLLANWQCVYGNGCRGIHPSQDASRMDGCCTYGAHFAEAEDFVKVLGFVPELTPEVWQHHARGQRLGWFKKLPNGRLATRTVQGACIFSNRPGFSGGVGCALHIAALQQGRRPIDVKPDVCWELPIRTEDSTDENGRRVITLRRWDKEDFGPEGSDMTWWCTDPTTAPEAHTAPTCVYESLRDELVELCGAELYARLGKALNM